MAIHSNGKGEQKTSPARRHAARRSAVKRLTVCAMLTSLGVIIVWLGAMVDVLDLCTAALAAMLTIPVVIEYGKTYPWGIYAATSVLSLLLLPNKMPAMVYVLFGYYPIVKAYLERLRPLACRLCKQAVFVVAEVAVIWLSDVIVGADVMPPWYHAALFVAGFLVLNLFDFALTRLITLYVIKYRPRLSKWMN